MEKFKNMTSGFILLILAITCWASSGIACERQWRRVRTLCSATAAFWLWRPPSLWVILGIRGLQQKCCLVQAGPVQGIFIQLVEVEIPVYWMQKTCCFSLYLVLLSTAQEILPTGVWGDRKDERLHVCPELTSSQPSPGSIGPFYLHLNST